MTDNIPPLNNALSTDEQWMSKAIQLAQNGLYTARPNPAVGCVIVKDGKIVGEGFHPKAGQPHAEVFALQSAGEDAKDATAYVTLEPCSHFGKTPPCADALIKAGIKKVVIASHDPNPLVAGRGIQKLKDAGITVVTDTLRQKADTLNRGFFKIMRGELPFVRLKIATSLDGRTAMPDGTSKWITGPDSRKDVQKLRAGAGAIITGSGTILADNPLLNVRNLPSEANPEYFTQPLRVILDRQNKTGMEQIYNGADLTQPVLKLVAPEQLTEAKKREKPGLTVQTYTGLTELLNQLKTQYHVNDVLIEAGSELAGAFLKAGLVDELIVYMAPVLLGSNGRPFAWLDFKHMNEKLSYQYEIVERIGQDLKMTLKPVK